MIRATLARGGEGEKGVKTVQMGQAVSRWEQGGSSGQLPQEAQRRQDGQLLTPHNPFDTKFYSVWNST